MGESGEIKQTTFGELPETLKKTVALNMATANAAHAYDQLDVNQQMRFKAWDPVRRQSLPEAANPKYWTVAEPKFEQASWSLAKGAKPSDAINDIFSGNGGLYTTECAQGRSVMRLKGMHDYYVGRLGKEAGAFRFNADFATTSAGQKSALAYVDRFQKSGQSWAEFTKANPPPQLDYAMTVQRHNVTSVQDGETKTFFRNTSSGVAGAAGDNGYFGNYSVSIEGVNIGYVGENVIDVGFKDGQREFWGHPGGIQTEAEWQAELNDPRIVIDSMAEFADYFTPGSYTGPGAAKALKEATNWLTTGPLSSRSKTQAWLKTDEFKTWYEQKAGKPFAGPTTLGEMSTAQLQEIVELAIPLTEYSRTIYSEVNRGGQLLSHQMANFLRDGKLPPAEYLAEGVLVPD